MSHNLIRVFIDLDGTLLNSRGNISSDTKQEICFALNRGIDIWLCSGRPYCFTQKISNSIDNRIKTISYNGCMIESAIQSSFELQTLQNILELLSPESLVIFKSKTTLYSNRLPVIDAFAYRDELPQYRMSELPLTDYINEPILKILILEKNKYGLMKEKLISNNIECMLIFYDNVGFEIAPKNISKGSAIRKIRQQHDFIIGIGNDQNDISLFEESNLAVAMENSVESILKFADVVIASNDNNGVGKYLKTLNNLKENKI